MSTSVNQRTQKVLEKWGVEGENSMNEEDVKKAAESFARIQIKNRFLKKVAVGGTLFLVVFIGLMLGSVILGIDISKDFNVKNQALVSKSNSEVLHTGEMFYSVNLGLSTPLSTIKGIKSLKFQNKDKTETLQFNVVSFYYIQGRNLTFYGHKHVANVMGNGDVVVYPIKSENGAKRIDESQVMKRDSSQVSAVGSLSSSFSGVTWISDCEGLSRIGSSGFYSLVNNIQCTLTQPLLPNGFSGVLNGNGHIITLHMNVNGPAALFANVNRGKIANVLLNGDISGVQNCAGFAVSATSGSIFLANGMYATINCKNGVGATDYITVGGSAALLRNPSGSTDPVSFIFSVSQGNLNAVSSDTNLIAYTGSFYGRSGIRETVRTKFTYTYAASRMSSYGNNSHVDNFGFKYSFPSTKSLILKKDVYVPEDCYNYDYSPAYINMCVSWFLENYYENPDCCYYFDSCPYVMCSTWTQVCMFCRHGTRSDIKGESTELTQIVPTVQQICEGF